MASDGTLLDERHVTDSTLNEFAREYVGTQVAIEATGFYRHVYETLDVQVYVTLVNPKTISVIAETSIKTDNLDVQTLTPLLRANLVAESYVPPRVIPEKRDLVRTRKSLIKDRTRLKSHVRAVLNRTGEPVRPFAVRFNWSGLPGGALDGRPGSGDRRDVSRRNRHVR